MAVTRMFGASVKRREDPRLITGKGVFTDDIRLPGMTTMAVLRSPHAHARITRLDTSAASQMPGVLLVLTAKDLEGKLGGMPCAWLIPNADLKLPVYPALAGDKVRYVGDAVAAVVAETQEQASDAAAAIEVEYDVLPAVVNQEKAAQSGAAQLHDDVPNNVGFTFKLNGGDADAAFKDADVVVKQRFVNQRLIPSPMETRGAVASWSPGTEELTLWVTSQNPHIERLLVSLTLGIPETKVRVISRDVGGGFGCKIAYYGGEALAIIASRELGRPVKWIEDRSENFQATTHGRDHIQDVEMAVKRDGTITGIRVKAWASLGAYLSTAAPGVPTWLFTLMLTGPYDIKNMASEVLGVFTNTTPTDAYRGAGRPEATFLIERMVDLVARELNMDPVALRRKNLVAADKFPYTSAEGLLYDSGNYQGTLDQALKLVGYDELRQRQTSQQNSAKRIGIGFSTYVEVCGLAPSAAAGAMGFQGGLWESAVVRMHPTGKVTVLTGSSPHGQGEETTFAQLVNQELGVPVEDVEVVHGDTGSIPFGMGTYGSRSTAVGGTAIVFACRKVRDKAAKIAAHLLEVSPDDLSFDDGRFSVKGTDKAKTIQEVSLASYLAWSMPEGVTPGLEENHFHDPTNNTFPFGCHICVTEVDTETGQVEILRYVAVDDVGTLINPMIVEGQIHGGLAQGIGQALWEAGIYDDDGQLLSGTFADYAVPRADTLPTFELGRSVTPSPSNPMGVKGVGETGTIASTPAVINSIVDALKGYGIKDIAMPATPQRVWQAIQAAGK